MSVIIELIGFLVFVGVIILGAYTGFQWFRERWNIPKNSDKPE